MNQKNVFLAGYFFLLSLFGFQLDVHSQPKDDWQAGSAYQFCGKTSTLYCFIETAETFFIETANCFIETTENCHYRKKQKTGFIETAESCFF